jgi:hypothetical protein
MASSRMIFTFTFTFKKQFLSFSTLVGGKGFKPVNALFFPFLQMLVHRCCAVAEINCNAVYEIFVFVGGFMRSSAENFEPHRFRPAHL